VYCPACNHPLNDERYEAVAVAVCARCRAYWVGNEEFLEILRRRERLFADSEIERVLTAEMRGPSGRPAPPRRMKCPVCADVLQAALHPYSSRIAIDRCPRGCGVYLDEEECDHLQILVEDIEAQAEDYILKHSLTSPSREVLSDIESFRIQASLWHRVLQTMRDALRRRMTRSD